VSGWIELTFEVDAAEAEALEEALNDVETLAVTFSAATDELRFGEPDQLADQGVNLQAKQHVDQTALWSRTHITGLFDHGIDVDHTLLRLARWLPAQIKTIEDAAWQRVWMSRYKPLQISPQLWIRPSWCEPIANAEIEIVLDPGMAFGTGTHPTTQLCLRWLCNQHGLAGSTLIDYGCGSGILSIAAAKLGATDVSAVDVDVEALKASAENAQRNAVADIVHPLAPSGLAKTTVDLLVANILAGPLLALCETFAECLSPGGRIALSGITADQAHELLVAYRRWFSMETPVPDRGSDAGGGESGLSGSDWVLLQGQRF
jgi:ribosomal protein L11 methyltransferase